MKKTRTSKKIKRIQPSWWIPYVKQLTAAGVQLKLWGTFIIDLTQDENALWNNLDRAAHRMIKKCQNDNITVEGIKNKN